MSACTGRIALPLLRIDVDGTSNPLGFIEEAESFFELAIAPPIQSYHEPVTGALEQLEVLHRDNIAVSHKDDTAEAESLLQVADDLLHSVVIDTVSRPYVMGDWPACDHHHADYDLNVMRLTVATVTVFGEIFGAGTLEVRTGDVVENQVWLETEEIAEAEIESL